MKTPGALGHKNVRGNNSEPEDFAFKTGANSAKLSVAESPPDFSDEIAVALRGREAVR